MNLGYTKVSSPLHFGDRSNVPSILKFLTRPAETRYPTCPQIPRPKANPRLGHGRRYSGVPPGRGPRVVPDPAINRRTTVIRPSGTRSGRTPEATNLSLSWLDDRCRGAKFGATTEKTGNFGRLVQFPFFVRLFDIDVGL
jgi:hypothetical protein